MHVSIRVRPFTARELGLGAKSCLSLNGDGRATATTAALSVTDGATGQSHDFSFNTCHWGDSGEGHDNGGATQDDVYADIGASALDNAWQGYNVGIFAYGQTGSGKSYSMVGGGGSSGGGGGGGGGGGEDERGIIPRISAELFARIEHEKSSGEVRVEVSMLEVYCERVRDLLTPGHAGAGGADLRVSEHPRDGATLEGLRVCAVTSAAQLARLLADGRAWQTLLATSSSQGAC